jgi:Flp pilus assembly protein TadG
MKQPTSGRKQRGSVLVETGLVFTTFAFLVIGAFDFGQFLFVHQALVERTRNATRWGAVNDPTNVTAVQNMVLYNQPTVPSGASTYFGLTTDMVQVSNPGSGTSDYRLTVLVTNYPYTILSPYISGSYIGPNIKVSVPLGQ